MKKSIKIISIMVSIVVVAAGLIGGYLKHRNDRLKESYEKMDELLLKLCSDTAGSELVDSTLHSIENLIDEGYVVDEDQLSVYKYINSISNISDSYVSAANNVRAMKYMDAYKDVCDYITDYLNPELTELKERYDNGEIKYNIENAANNITSIGLDETLELIIDIGMETWFIENMMNCIDEMNRVFPDDIYIGTDYEYCSYKTCGLIGIHGGTVFARFSIISPLCTEFTTNHMFTSKKEVIENMDVGISTIDSSITDTMVSLITPLFINAYDKYGYIYINGEKFVDEGSITNYISSMKDSMNNNSYDKMTFGTILFSEGLNIDKYMPVTAKTIVYEDLTNYVNNDEYSICCKDGSKYIYYNNDGPVIDVREFSNNIR